MTKAPKDEGSRAGIQVGTCPKGHVHVLVHRHDGEVFELVYDADDAYELAKNFNKAADIIIGV